ncbi:MAG: hypothetical protein M1337_06395 [Actinobacteria bacterium]|nr:hypothetical protein [Actinomycetota bacterium]
MTEIPTIVVVKIAPIGGFEVAVSAEKVMLGFEPAQAPYAGAGEPEWVRERRESAQVQLGKVPFPRTTEEIWRYSRVEELEGKGFSLGQAAPALETVADPPADGLPGGLVAEAACLIRVRPGTSRAFIGTSSPVTFMPATQAPASPREIESGSDFFRLFAEAYSPDLYVLRIPARPRG